MSHLSGLLGVAAILALAFLLSSDKRAIRPRVVGAAFALQAVIAFLVLYTPWGRAGILGMSHGVANLLGYANKGTEFLFGPSDKNPLAQTFALGALPAGGEDFRHRLRSQRPAHQVDHRPGLDALALLVVAHRDDAKAVLRAQP